MMYTMRQLAASLTGNVKNVVTQLTLKNIWRLWRLMSEQRYQIKGKTVVFSEESNEFPCLCCFYENYIDDGETIDVNLLQSLALFGAVFRLIYDGYYDYIPDGGYIYIPDDVPEWVLAKVRLIRIIRIPQTDL